MKTTMIIPDYYHKQLKKLAIDRSQSLAELIVEAIRSTFFPQDPAATLTAKTDVAEKYPVLTLGGSLKSRTSEAKITDLKKLWNKKRGV